MFLFFAIYFDHSRVFFFLTRPHRICPFQVIPMYLRIAAIPIAAHISGSFSGCWPGPHHLDSLRQCCRYCPNSVQTRPPRRGTGSDPPVLYWLVHSSASPECAVGASTRGRRASGQPGPFQRASCGWHSPHSRTDPFVRRQQTRLNRGTDRCGCRARRDHSDRCDVIARGRDRRCYRRGRRIRRYRLNRCDRRDYRDRHDRHDRRYRCACGAGPARVSGPYI